MDPQLGLFPDEILAPASPALGPASDVDRYAELAERLPERLRLGTSSWSFPGWEGLVYDRRAPEAVLAHHGLRAYSRHPLLRTVGVDRTYYRPISAEDFRAYAEAVPEAFRFLVKAERAVTSPTDPEASSIRGVNPRFLDPHYATDTFVAPALEGLGSRAGPLLFQFSPIPPNLVGGRAAFVERLHGFLDALPEGPLYAVELRTPAFFTEAYGSALEAAGAAHCYTVHPAMTPLDRQLSTLQAYEQPALVLRWMLHAGLRYEAARDRYAPFDRLVDRDDESRERITIAALDALIAERDVFVIANNKAEGSAPLSVFELAERIADWDGPSPRQELDSDAS